MTANNSCLLIQLKVASPAPRLLGVVVKMDAVGSRTTVGSDKLEEQVQLVKWSELFRILERELNVIGPRLVFPVLSFWAVLNVNRLYQTFRVAKILVDFFLFSVSSSSG